MRDAAQPAPARRVSPAWPLLACALLACPGAARAESLVAQRGATATLACRGEEAVVRGDSNQLTFAGPCRGLVVKGSGNTVAIDLVPGTTVRIVGDANRVVYAPQEGVPHTVVRGADDTVVPATPMIAPVAEIGPPPLVVSGAPLDVSCAGRDVVVRGDGLRPVLRGGCRSLTVDGRYDSITAELLPGALVSVGAPAVIINYVLVGTGPPPVVRTTQPGLGATQLQHFGGEALAVPTDTGQ